MDHACLLIQHSIWVVGSGWPLDLDLGAYELVACLLELPVSSAMFIFNRDDPPLMNDAPMQVMQKL